MPMISDLEYYPQRWGTNPGWVIRFSWNYEDRPVRVILLAKNGRHYAKPKPPDDSLVGYLMANFGMKVSAARLLARRVPKGTEVERILAVHRMYEKEGGGE